MKNRVCRFRRVSAVLILAAAAAGSCPLDIFSAPGRPAPPFELPIINGHGFQNSSDLFGDYAYTFLVFWDGECPHCVESLRQCEIFFEEQTGDEVAIVGIHAERGNRIEVEQLLETNAIYFPQLWDAGGEAGQNYSVSFATFTLFLVNTNGEIVAHKPDPQGDMKLTLEGMLRDARETSPSAGQGEIARPATKTPAPVFPHAGFVFHGKQRVRYLSIDATGAGAAGPYGEEVEPGNHLLYRFELEMSRKINRNLRVGGLLRISNEGEDVLAAGPQYLGSEWGSAFAEANADRFLFRIGYFEISMTPLTLMRWDWADNPRVGGNAGCGCGAAAGILLVESLEELGPELLFEGASASYQESGVELRAFYAIPRRATLTTAQEVNRLDWERARYSLEIFGLETLWRRPDSRTGSSWEIGLHLLRSWEDRRSVDFGKLGYTLVASDPWYSSTIVSADYSLPVIRNLELAGEWILLNDAQEHLTTCACTDTFPRPAPTKGQGGTAGLIYSRSPGWKFRCDYLYLNDDFYSPFAALSYEPNREGLRFSAQVPVLGEKASATVFYKKLRELDITGPNAEKENYSFFGASFDVELPNGVGGSLGWLDNGAWRTGDVNPTDEQRRALVVEARYRFDKGNSIQAQYQRIDGSVLVDDAVEESLTNIYRVYLSARF